MTRSFSVFTRPFKSVSRLLRMLELPFRVTELLALADILLNKNELANC